ncbi:OsmC family protein [Pelomonas sp. SE-A7]|uniref:OsmC family protein n=1 Tax=Pelomonas sp. SE-A7 TaxID=3054953 RepID=UPI00259C8B63|nr:OsmC family protein [Pelomonas sp. SE-A7]MDM4764720.1 OsmC family protein [Pelomonas sp. SE-A7]
MSEATVSIELRQQHDYQFLVEFGNGVIPLLADEPPPLGQAGGPSPVQLLAAAVGNCMSNSLLFALRKYRQSPEPLSSRITALLGRNAENRVRVVGLQAELRLGVPAASLQHLDRVLATFEDYCTVTRSVAAGIPVTVSVYDSTGTQLK